MTERPTPPVLVFCRRVERYLGVEEHVRCPYCDGHEERVRRGVHDAFCDFVPGRDPVHFGFPEDKGRYA